MKKIYAQIAILFLGLISTFYTANAQKKRPDFPYISNSVSGCTNDIIACSLFTNSQNYTCASSFTYAAPTNNNNCFAGTAGVSYGCLSSTPNQMWFVITVQTGGILSFSFTNSAGRDIDAAIWGTIANGDLANVCSATTSTPLSCDYSSNSVANLSISNAVAGQKYVLLVTNYSNGITDINIQQPFGGTVSYCKVNAVTCVAPTVALSGNSTINQGQSANITLTFTGAAPFSYTLSDGQSGTTSTNPLTLAVSPLSTTTYTATSVSNGCGAGTTSGSATVTVTRTAGLITCLPLDANANDQIGSNNGSVFSNGGSFSYTTNRNGTASSALSISNGAYVEFPTNNLLNNNFTHSIWVSPAGLPSNGNNSYILSIGGIGQSQELYIENVGGVLGWVFRSATTAGNIDVKYQGAITAGAWYHVAIVRTANALQMYVNGVLVQSSSAAGLSSTYSSPSVGRLGTQSSGLVNFFNGKIDDVRLFKGGLNGLEISSLYNATLNCPPIVDVPLISLTSVTDNTLCRNQLESITFQQSSVAAGSSYTVQLSDASGSFTNPTTIGTGTLAPIQISIPTSIITSGAGYLIRIINGTTISFNTLPVTVLPTATGTISGSTTINVGQSANLSINLTGTAPWVYTVSDGVNVSNYTTSLASITQNVSPAATTTYTLGSIRDNVCGTGTTSGSAIITVNPNTQLLACYPFNGNAQDSKGTNHGTVNGATLTTDRFGNANSAYSFNGASNYIAIPGASLAPAEYTYAAWVNTNTLNDYSQTILSIGWLGADQVLALSNTTGTTANWNFASYIYQAALPIPQILSTIGVTANTWHFVVATRTLNELKLYIDGQIVGTTSSTGLPPLYATPIAGAIGARSRADIQFFNGKIDDVKIYNGALNQAQITGIYLAEQQCPIVETGGLITATSLSTTTSCPSGKVNVNVITNNITASAGTPLSVELSNSSGSFASPIQIGTGTTNNILCTIPANITAGNYKIRVTFGTSPNQVISVNTLPLTINPAPTATISGTVSIITGGTASLTVNFTGTGPWTYRLSGNTTDVTTSVSPATISVSPTITTTYTLTSVNNTCGVGITSGSAVITINIIPQLLACYKFDGNAQDSKGNHSGTISGATLTADRFGKPNSAYNFDGNSYIQLANPDDFKNNTFTYSAWVNATILPISGTFQSIIGISSGQVLGFGYVAEPVWAMTSYYSASVPTYDIHPSSVVGANLNAWHHVVTVRSSTTIKLYIDGVLVRTSTATSSGVPIYTHSNPAVVYKAMIGTRPDASNIQFFNGKIDDVKIYNGTLSDEEVLMLYNEEQGECSSPCSGMIYSLGSGNWNTPTTWSCGRVPDLTDKVLIKAGHTITISTNDAKAKKLLDNGQVSFANSTSKLTFGNGVAQSLVYENQPNATIGKDALVSSYLLDGNHETVNYMGPYAGTQGGTNNINRTFIAFDLSTIPTNAIVDSAYLTLYYSQAIVDILYRASTYFDGHVGNTPMWIQKVLEPWSENTITWNNQPASSMVNQVSVPAYTSKTQNYKLNVKTLVQGMVAIPSSNYGFMLKLQNETPYSLVALASSDETNPNIRPKIQVYYRLP
jgi:hypothetical protein